MDEQALSDGHHERGTEGTSLPGGAEPRLPYQSPALRSHGALLDMTAQQKSGEVLLVGVLVAGSDVSLKENVIAIAWR